MGDVEVERSAVALIEDPPKVVDFPQDEIVVMEGRRLELPECKAAAGNPPPTAGWEGTAATVIDSVSMQG